MDDWHIWFAWRPVKNVKGRWIFMRKCFRRWVPQHHKNWWGDFSGYADYDWVGAWEYE